VSVKNHISLALAGLGLLLVLGPAEARTYKWVDDNGVTQYSQTPPPKRDYEVVHGPAKPATGSEKTASDLEIRLHQFEQRRDEAAKQKAERQKAKQVNAQRRTDCEKSKQNLEYLENHPQIRLTDEDGSVRYLTEKERQEKIQASRDNINKLCK
jgi:hypothetical protein